MNGLYTVQNDGLEADDQVHPPVGELCFQLGGVSFEKREFHQGKFFPEGGQDMGQKRKAAGVGDAHPQRAQVVAVDIADLGEKLAVEIQDLGGGLHQLVAGVSQREFGRTGEELDVQFPLHIGNVVGQRLLGDIQPLGGAGDVQLFRNHQKILQMKKIQGQTLLCEKMCHVFCELCLLYHNHLAVATLVKNVLFLFGNLCHNISNSEHIHKPP